MEHRSPEWNVPPRSALYVPGHRADLLSRALERGADSLIVDLEDAVPLDQKDAARAAVAAWLADLDPGDCAVWVRVNPGAPRLADVEAIAASPALAGICLAKTDDVAEVEAVADLLTWNGSSAAIAPVLETATAVLAAPAIARAPRVRRLQLGEADLVGELGLEPDEVQSELAWIRTMVVLASSAAGLEPPLGPVATDFRDLDALRASSLRLRRAGFRGRACIHPAQLAVVHEVFTPSDAEVAAARAAVERFDAAGGGAVVGADGTLVDEAVVRRSRRILAQVREPSGP